MFIGDNAYLLKIDMLAHNHMLWFVGEGDTQLASAFGGRAFPPVSTETDR